MKEIVKAVAAQIEVKGLDSKANLAKVINFIERIVQEYNAELIVYPELTNSGYVIGRERDNFCEFSVNYLNNAEKIPGEYTNILGELAKKYSIHIVIGLLEAHPIIPSTLYNTSVLIGPSGAILGIYRKIHIPAEERHYFYSGNELEVFQTELGNIGLMICADIAFPETARILTLKGAEIICQIYAVHTGVFAGDKEARWRIASCRAFENNIFLVGCNRSGQEGNVFFAGRSCICGPQGEFLARSEIETEDIIAADLKADVLKAARMKYTRFRDRRPDLYGKISQT